MVQWDAGQGIRRCAAGVGALVLLTATLAGCARDPAGTDASDPTSPPFLNMAAEVKYVGAAECRSCHLGIHTTYKQTGMGMSLYPLTADNVVEDFTDNNLLVTDTGVRYRMYERDGRFYQRQFVLDSAGNEMAAEERELINVIGSNNHSRSYVTMIDDKWFQAPVCWYPQAEKWDLCPGYQIANEHFSREINSSCIVCHNGRMELVEGERNQYQEPVPHGIDCERCHGPGELHVARWNTGETPRGETDRTIVNPRRLPTQERVEVCFQCHLGDARATTTVAVHGRTRESYRPGERMIAAMIPFRYADKTEWDFGLSSQADRMLLSKCYEASDRKLECLTCHNPHVTVYSEDTTPDFFRRKCLTCHDVESCTEPFETRATTQPSDNCVTCHMRTAEPDDQRYTTFTDHWIRRTFDLTEPDHRESFAVEPFYPEDLASFPAAEQHYYRGRAVYLLAEDAPRVRYREMWGEAEIQFRSALDKGYENENVWFFLGKTLTYLGRHPDAIAAYEKALAFAPKHHDARFALGTALAHTGNIDRAAQVFQSMLADDPGNVMALSEYGRAVFGMQRLPEALAAWERAVAEEPWDSTLRLNLGMGLAALGRMDEAAEAGEVAVRLNPSAPETWSLYWNAMREAGRVREAQEGKLHFDRTSAGPAKTPPGH